MMINRFYWLHNHTLGGSAEESDLIRVGDIILAINHHDLSNMDYQNALHCLRSKSFKLNF